MLQPLFLAETATQDLVTINWTFIAQICNLFIQMLLIKKFLFKPVREILAKRQAKADADIREAEEAIEVIIPGEISSGNPSTIIDLTGDEIKLIRKGPIPLEELNRLL